jgi:hypothetical protein
MFDAWNKDESWERFEKLGTNETDPPAQHGSADVGEGGEIARAHQPRMVCMGFLVFRL